MGKTLTSSELKCILNKYNFNFSRKLGQNFLIDINILNKILENIENDNIGVLEIGPGAGVLTLGLSKKAKKVVAVEIDSKLIPILNEVLIECDNVKIINEDILKVDINSLIEDEFSNMDVVVAANLPYYITTPIIMRLLEQKANVSSIILMIQKEVAQRIVSSPGGKEYGALSIAVQYYCEPELILNVSPHCFIPQPKVESTIIKLKILDKPKVHVESEKLFFNIVKAAFNQRRKTLVNALSNSIFISFSKEDIKKSLREMNKKDNIRGEELSIEDFAILTGLLGKYIAY
jgi:16S rRNA (adenine1518-N6/adenine1519-N6)-dimethyltransferase